MKNRTFLKVSQIEIESDGHYCFHVDKIKTIGFLSWITLVMQAICTNLLVKTVML